MSSFTAAAASSLVLVVYSPQICAADTFCLSHGRVCNVLLYLSSIGDTVQPIRQCAGCYRQCSGKDEGGGSGRQEPPRASLSILGFGGKPLVSTNKTINPSDLIDVLFGVKGSLMSVQPDVQLNLPPPQKVQHYASRVQYSVKFKTSVMCGDI